VAHNVRRLICVFEFEKQMIMNITKDELKTAVETYVEKMSGGSKTDAKLDWLAGVEWLRQKCEQTACYTTLELLQQMLIEKQKQQTENKGGGIRPIDYEIDSINHVMKLIKERPANVV